MLIQACARDACRALLLNRMHETRLFDPRLLSGMLTNADVSERMLTYADIC